MYVHICCTNKVLKYRKFLVNFVKKIYVMLQNSTSFTNMSDKSNETNNIGFESSYQESSSAEGLINLCKNKPVPMLGK